MGLVMMDGIWGNRGVIEMTLYDGWMQRHLYTR